MDKKYLKLKFAIAFGAIIFGSCEKNGITELTNQTDDPNVSTVIYYLDDTQVTDTIDDPGDTGLFIVRLINPENNFKSSSNQVIETRAYSSEEKYIEFGSRYGYDFRKPLDFEKKMSSFAEESGAIAEYEKTGKVPSWYTEYEKVTYDSIFWASNSSLKSTKASLFVVFFKDFYGQGSSLGMATSWPIMPAGWKDKASSVEFVGLGGGINNFDRSFYRKRLETVINLGMTKINLSASNNRMNSSIRFL